VRRPQRRTHGARLDRRGVLPRRGRLWLIRHHKCLVVSKTPHGRLNEVTGGVGHISACRGAVTSAHAAAAPQHALM
jgi:hypothetical protein